MPSTCMVIPMPTPSRICHLLATVALVTLSSAWTSSASAAVAWHADIATASRASEISQRPVLAIFTASWSSASTTLDRTTLASDEAVALITACFEPVCVDVDASPEATRRLGISKVPTACILTADDQLLSKFELPETPAAFVAAAARAAQEAAFASAAASHAQPNATVATSDASLQTFAETSVRGSDPRSTFGTDPGKARPATARAEVMGTVPPGGQAINAIAAKVRRLSDFASDDASTAASTHPALAAAFREDPVDQLAISPATMPSHGAQKDSVAAEPADAMISHESQPVAADSATTASTAGPATVAFVDPSQVGSSSVATGSAAASSGFTPVGQGTQSPLAIEPSPVAPSNSAAASASWLGAPPQNQPTAATPPATSEQPTAAAPAAPPAASLAETKPEKPASTTASLLAALQKPFSLFARPTKPKPVAESTATAASPTTVATAAATPAEPDTYGSMPVGLEGYCPVTLTERGVWIEGRAQWGVRHRGRTYLFAGVEQQKAFLSDPDRYAPALSGDDPVLAFDNGKSTPGQRRYGVTYQSRTYLFTSPETRDAFAANPQRYTSGAMVAENRRPSDGPVVR